MATYRAFPHSCQAWCRPEPSSTTHAGDGCGLGALLQEVSKVNACQCCCRCSDMPCDGAHLLGRSWPLTAAPVAGPMRVMWEATDGETCGEGWRGQVV